MPTFTGTHRIKGENGDPDMVGISDGDMDLDPISEEDYKFGMFKPDLEDLPWRQQLHLKKNMISNSDVEKAWNYALSNTKDDSLRRPRIQVNDDVENVIEIPLQESGVEVYRRDAGGNENDWELLK